MNSFSIEQLETFVKLFSSYSPDYEKESFNYFFLSHKGKNQVVSGYGNLSGNLSDIKTHLKEVGDKGSLHIQINKSKTTSRKVTDVIATRVLLLDLDTPREREEVLKLIDTLAPHWVVESSPKKYHFYWQIEEYPLTLWQDYQRALALEFNGDINMAQLAKTIRVAGVRRFDKGLEGFMPEIKYIREGIKPIKLKEIKIYFPEMNNWIEKAKKYNKKVSKETLKLQKLAETPINDIYKLAVSIVNSIEEATFKGRNSFIYDVAKSFAYNRKKEAHIEKLLEAINEGFTRIGKDPLDTDELNASIKNGINKGKELLINRDNGVKDKLNRVINSEYYPILEEREESEEREEELKEELEEDADDSGSRDTTPDYSYNYESRDIAFNRFSDIAITDRLLQRYGTHIVRTGKLLYAFDETSKVWRSQKGTKEVLHGFCVDILRDTVLDPEFENTYAIDSKGNININKLKQAQEKFLSHKKVASTLYDILESNKIYRKEIYEFDDRNHFLYCENGVLNMITGEVREPKATDYLLHRTRIEYDESASCPWWEDYLAEVYANSKDSDGLVRFMQELFGYTLAGGIDEQKIFIHWGGGCNGKSKVLDTLSLLGGEYASRLTCNALTKSKGAIQKEIERLGVKFEGKRVVIIDDLDTATQWNEGLIKGLTSKTLLSRRLYEEEKDIPNRSKVHIGCNQAPSPESENYGILRRLCIIPYLRTFVQNSHMEGVIQREVAKGKSGILKWSVEGYRRVLERRGIKYPRAVETTVEEYRKEHFTLDISLETMFEIPKKADGSFDESYQGWIPLKEIVEELEGRAIDEGRDPRDITQESVKKLIKSKMGLDPVRIYSKKYRNTISSYQLKKI